MRRAGVVAPYGYCRSSALWRGDRRRFIRQLPRICAQSAGCFQRGARKHPSLARLFSMLFCVGALRKHAGGMFLASDRSSYAARREARKKSMAARRRNYPRPGGAKTRKPPEAFPLREIFKETAMPWGLMITCLIAGGSPPRRCSASNIRSRADYRRGRPAIHGRSKRASLIIIVGPYEADVPRTPQS